MDINRLNEFITLATLLNYSKAANQLYLTQPALSRHIHDLEQTLGTQLFIRDTHNVHLTSVGEIFLKEAQEIIQRYNHALDLIKEVSQRFVKERIAVSLNDLDALLKQQHLIEEYSTEMIFMHRLDLNSVVNVTEIQCVVVTDTMEESEILNILKSDGVKGVSGRFISRLDMSKLVENGFTPLPTWQDALSRYLKEIKA